MATYTININERTSAGKALLDYLISLGVIIKNKAKTREETSGYNETLQAIKEMKEGKVVRYKNFEDFKKKMYGL